MEQERIWDHFQTTGVDAFGHAGSRYEAMAREARSRLGRGGGRVLNIGVGPGRLERLLVARGWQVSALDPSAKAIARFEGVPVDARCGYAQDMPFETGSFDVVIASEVLEHIAPDVRKRVLEEVRRVLVPGGWFVGSVPYRENLAEREVICPDCGKVFHRWGHVSSFDIPQVESEFAATFTDVRCRRRSFVDWNSARGVGQLVKALARSILGFLGESIASPSIIFSARRNGNS